MCIIRKILLKPYFLALCVTNFTLQFYLTNEKRRKRYASKNEGGLTCGESDCPAAPKIPTASARSDPAQTPGKKRVSQWEMLMRKFSEAHKEECKAVTLDIPRVKRAEKTFPTGSSYTGMWDVLGMSGYGTYKFTNGVIYEGEFDDGTFHGRGELRYPSGAVLMGKWNRGEMIERTLIFPDGLQYSEQDWAYCMKPDRRFTIEIDNGLEPAGRSYLTAEQPSPEIPEGYYDTGDGFYDAATKAVYTYSDVTHIIRKPSVREQQWIINNCRTNPMKTLGPQPHLYEEWSKPQAELQAEESPNPVYSSGVLTSKCNGLNEDDSVSVRERPEFPTSELLHYVSILRGTLSGFSTISDDSKQ